MLTTKLARSIVAFAAIPVIVELFIAYIKKESYSIPRASLVLAGLVIVAALLFSVRSFVQRLQIMLTIVSAFGGAAVMLAGYMVAASRSRDAHGLLGVSIIGLGLIIVGVTSYATYSQWRGLDMILAIRESSAERTTIESEHADYKVVTTMFSGFDGHDEEILNLCRQEVNPHDVHFIGYYVERQCRFHVDVLESAELNRYFHRSDRAAKRTRYERVGRQIDWIVHALNRYMENLDRGVLIRTILDVEQGSISYYYLDVNVYLVGVTMEQSKVLDVDEKLRSVVNAIGLLPRGWISRPATRQQVI